jgi:hypothetical protein
VAQGKPAQDGNAERIEMVAQGVEDRPAAVLVAGELVDAAEGDTSDTVERSGVPELREPAITAGCCPQSQHIHQSVSTTNG